MQERRLSVVKPRAAAAGPPRGRAWVLAAIIALAAAVATRVGVDPVRRPIEARTVAESAIEQALTLGSGGEDVRAALVELRKGLGLRTLDSNTRVVYANLLLGFSRTLDDRYAAAFHAERAAELAPVTVPVVRVAALVLAQSGEVEASLSWIRAMFSYDPRSAAELLRTVEPLLFTAQVEQGLPDDPEAWNAWSQELRMAGRTDEADAWLERAHARWPEHLLLWRKLAAAAARADDWERLAGLLPVAAELPAERPAATLLAYRALWRAEAGDLTGARDDLDRALALDGETSLMLLAAGEAQSALGRHDEARRSWNRALFNLEAGSEARRLRLDLLVRLARLEERYGEPAQALRLWRSVLELEPQHGEARRRVEELTGSRR